MRSLAAAAALLVAAGIFALPAAAALEGDRPAGRSAASVPQMIEFQVWLLAVESPVRAEELVRSSLPAAGRWRVTFADSAVDLARTVSELLASARQEVASSVRGQAGGVGVLVGSLGYPVRLRMRAAPAIGSQAGVALPDLRETELALELMALSVAPDGRILTRITLELGGERDSGPRASYRHTLWLDERAGAPLAFLWGQAASRPPDGAGTAQGANGLAGSHPSTNGISAVSGADRGPVYALGVSARLARAPGPTEAMVRVAEVSPLQEPFFRILDDSHRSRPERAPAARFEIGLDAWLSRESPVWHLRLTQPLWEGNWVVQGEASWADPPAEVEARVALRMRLIHDLALLFQAGSRFSDTGEAVSPTLGFGLAETTYPLDRLSLEARFLPIVYARPAGSSAWSRQQAGWQAAATLRGASWSLSLDAAQWALQGLDAGGTLSADIGRGFVLHAGWRTFPDSGRNFFVVGLSYRPAL